MDKGAFLDLLKGKPSASRSKGEAAEQPAGPNADFLQDDYMMKSTSLKHTRLSSTVLV